MQIMKAKVDNTLQDLHKSSDYNMKADSSVLLIQNDFYCKKFLPQSTLSSWDV